eukprot:218387-Rhodomonas_salina.2
MLPDCRGNAKHQHHTSGPGADSPGQCQCWRAQRQPEGGGRGPYRGPTRPRARRTCPPTRSPQPLLCRVIVIIVVDVVVVIIIIVSSTRRWPSHRRQASAACKM